MLNVLKNNYGEYIKGFFFIRLDMELKEGIRPDEFTKEEYASFIHEYIHFMQNISTTYGLNYFIDISKFIQLFIHESSKYEQNIPYPIEIEKTGVENAYEELELKSFYLGQDDHIKIHHLNKVDISEDEIINDILNSEDMRLETVNIYYDDKDIPYIFGAACIEESMAYLIENVKFGGLLRKNEFPYNSCEIVCRDICPELEERKDILVALAELSLMHYHSGMMFIKLLNEIKDNKLVFKNSSEVITYFRERIPHLFENLEKEYKETASAIDFLYPADTPFKQVNIWIKDKIKKAVQLRNKYPGLISRTMDLSSQYSNELMKSLMNVFGIPPIADKNYEVFSSEYNMALALVPIAIYNEFCSKEKECYMYNYCKVGKMPNIDESCVEGPWKQSQKEELCPFGVFWYRYALIDKIIDK